MVSRRITRKGKRYAISDIHGCVLTLRYLVEEKIKLTPQDNLFLLGDYVNRGPDSKGVIDYVLALKGLGYKVHTLRGNHEDLLLDALFDRKRHAKFIQNGGDLTLESFGVQQVDEIPNVYLQFIKNTEFYRSSGKYLLVHAGFNFRAKDPFKDTHSMMWTRKFTIDKNILGERIIVHGHTPKPKRLINLQFRRSVLPQVLNIDSGCVYAPKKGSRLCALNLDTLEVTFCKNHDIQ